MIFITFTMMAFTAAFPLKPSSTLPLLEKEAPVRQNYFIMDKDNYYTGVDQKTSEKTLIRCLCNTPECLATDGRMKTCITNTGCFMDVQPEVAGDQILFGCQELMPENATCKPSIKSLENTATESREIISSPVQVKAYDCCSQNLCNDIINVSNSEMVNATEIDIDNVKPQNNTDLPVTATTQTATPIVDPLIKKEFEFEFTKPLLIALMSKFNETLWSNETEIEYEFENMTTTSVDGLKSDNDVTTNSLFMTSTGIPNESDIMVPTTKDDAIEIDPALPKASTSIPFDAHVTTKSSSTDELLVTTLKFDAPSIPVDNNTTTGNADSTTTSATGSLDHINIENAPVSVDTPFKPDDNNTTTGKTDSTTTSATGSLDHINIENAPVSIDTPFKPDENNTTTGNTDSTTTSATGSLDHINIENAPVSVDTPSIPVDSNTTTGNTDSTTTSATGSLDHINIENAPVSVDTPFKPDDNNTTTGKTDSTTTSATGSLDHINIENTPASVDTPSIPVDNNTTTGNTDSITTSATGSPDQINTENSPALTETTESKIPVIEETEEIMPKPEKCVGHRRKRHVVRHCITTAGPTEGPDNVKKVMLITPDGKKVDRWSRCIHHVPIYPDICI